MATPLSVRMKNHMVPIDPSGKIAFTSASYISIFVFEAVVESVLSFLLWLNPESSSETVNWSLFVYSMTLAIGFAVNGFILRRANLRIGMIVSLLLLPLPVIPLVFNVARAGRIIFCALLASFKSIFLVCVNSLVLDTWMGQDKLPSLFLGLQLFYALGKNMPYLTLYYVNANSYEFNRNRADNWPYASLLLALTFPPVIMGMFNTSLFRNELRKPRWNHFNNYQPDAPNLTSHDGYVTDAQTEIPLETSDSPNANVQTEPQVTWRSFVAVCLMLYSSAEVAQDVDFITYSYFNESEDLIVTLTKSLLALNLSAHLAKISAMVLCMHVSTSKLSVYLWSFAFVGLPMIYLTDLASWNYTGLVFFGFANGVFPILVLLTMNERKHLSVLAVGLFLFAKEAGTIFAVYIVYFFDQRSDHSWLVFSSLIFISVTLFLFLRIIR